DARFFCGLPGTKSAEIIKTQTITRTFAIIRVIRRLKFTSPPYAETGGGRSPLTVNQRSATPARLQRLAGAGTAARAFRAGPHLHKQADSPARLSEVSENRQERSTGNTCSRRRSSASGPC